MEFIHQSTPDLPVPGAPAETPAEASQDTPAERPATRLSDLVRLRELSSRLAGAADLDEALRELLAAGASVLGAHRGMVVVSGNREWSRPRSGAESAPPPAPRPGNRAAVAQSRPVVGTSTRRTVSADAAERDAQMRRAAGPPALGSIELPGTIVGLGLDRAGLGALETVPLAGGPFDALAAGAGEAVHRDLTARPPDAASTEAPAAAGGADSAGATAADAPCPRFLEVAAQLGLGSSYALPLAIGDGPPFGAAVWFRDRPWTPPERTRELTREYCADAARQLARELERQRLRHTAAALRDGLLPDRLPQVPRLRLAARCLPAGLDLAAGSDWYDAIVLPDGTVGLTVGSVGDGGPAGRGGPDSGRAATGRGTGAAAAMGRIRAALRAYAVLEGEDPVSVLGDLELLLKTTEPTRTATALYAVADPATRRLTLAGAGQCPPLLVTNYGAGFVETSLSAPLGMLSCWEAPSVEIRAERGDLLVLYTEGLARRSGGSLHTGEARLRAAAADAPYEARQDADRFCGHLLARCLEGTGDAEPVDDLVLMVARFC